MKWLFDYIEEFQSYSKPRKILTGWVFVMAGFVVLGLGSRIVGGPRPPDDPNEHAWLVKQVCAARPYECESKTVAELKAEKRNLDSMARYMIDSIRVQDAKNRLGYE